MRTGRKPGERRTESIEPDLFDAGSVGQREPDLFLEPELSVAQGTPDPEPVAVKPASRKPPVQNVRRKVGFWGGLWRWIKRLFWFGMFLLLVGAGVAWGVYLHFSEGLPTLNGLADYRPNLLTRVYARDYQLLGEFYIQRRLFIPRSEMPPRLIEALLAIEDSRFYQHPGIDMTGIARAVLANIKAGGRKVQGASTITQQVARTFLLTSIKSMERKIKEVILSLQIEQRFSKDEILELYFNQIYMGAGAYGMGAAAHAYFARDVSELTLGQMALLAGLPKAPSYYSPWRDPEKAKARQKLVLNRMADLGMITAEEAAEAAETPLNLVRPKESLEQIAPYYLEHVRRTILDEWGSDQLFNGGLEVHTALDPKLQRIAQNAVRKGLMEYDRRHGYRGPLARVTDLTPYGRSAWLKSHEKSQPTTGGFVHALVLDVPKQAGAAHLLLMSGKEVSLTMEGIKWARPRRKDAKDSRDGRDLGPAPKKLADLLAPGDVILVEPPEGKRTHYVLAQEPVAEAALVSMDPHTGQVLAMVGGYDFGRSEFNRAIQSVRQPGSSFKPFIYTAAMDKGYSPVDRIDDSPMPITYRDPNTGEAKVWQPENYEKRYYGPTTIRVALTHSRNLVTVRLAKTMGIPFIGAYVKQFGLEIPSDRQDLSISLGSFGFSPLKMTAAYAVFANGGKRVDPVYIARVQDRFGRTVFRHGGGDCLLCHQEPERIIPQAGEAPNSAKFGKPVLNPASIYQVVNLMKGVVKYGTARKALALNRPVAGKTGTTNDYRDAWFMGIAPSLVAGVWVGMDDFSILGETGGQAALPIWMDYMQEALKGQPAIDFAVPSGIALEEIDAESGTLPGAHTANRVYEAFKPGQAPAAVASSGTHEESGGGGEAVVEEDGPAATHPQQPSNRPAGGGAGRGSGVTPPPAGGGRHGQGEMDGGLY
ncbi:MAG: PBP1A family penicillin-binding protein [Magnetococcales bacterium]|nr:PBP1A family penicillin-binding protein [Magnetococcales bacterium]NGZ07691.1 PBP1A family penicillin-binding protein [Magnetococcales bacterium]